jgi:hypothetical protein
LLDKGRSLCYCEVAKEKAVAGVSGATLEGVPANKSPGVKLEDKQSGRLTKAKIKGH